MNKIKATNCVICGKENEQKANGRGRKYCGVKCSRDYHKQKNASKLKLPCRKAQCQNCGNELTRADKSIRKCCTAYASRHGEGGIK